MAQYRNERIPEYGFVQKLKQVEPNLFVVFDSLSMRWDILYRNPNYGNVIMHVLRVCKKDHEGRDVGYEGLDDRVINKLLRMDMARRGITPKEYMKRVNHCDDLNDQIREKNDKDVTDYIFKHEKKTLERMYEAARSVKWS